MEVASTAFLSVGLAADAFAVSLSSGCSIKYIKLNKALKIALFLGGFQAMMPLIGWLMGLTFREFISQFDYWLTFLILVVMGSKAIWEACTGDEGCKPFNPLDSHTLLILAIATSIDALAAGVGLSMLKESIFLACTLIGVITFSLSLAGVFIGHRFGSICNQKIEIVGGAILIALGLKFLGEGLLA